MKKALLFFLKMAFAAGILTYLIIHSGITFEDFCRISPVFMVLSGACLLLQIFLTSVRWFSLLRCIGIELSFPETLSLSMQGAFFTLFIPAGSVGGDLVKAGILAKRAKDGQRFNGVFSILMDRLCGLVGLLIFTLSVCTFFLPVLQTYAQGLRFAIYMIMLVCAGLLVCTVLVFFYDFFYRIPFLKKFFDLLDRYSRGAFFRASEAVSAYRKQWKTILCWILLSAFILFPCLTASLCVIGYGVCGNELDLPSCILASDLSQTIAVIPLTNGGVGTRDYAAQKILSAGGCPAAESALIPLLYTAIFLTVSLFGAFFFIFDSFICSRKQKNT